MRVIKGIVLFCFSMIVVTACFEAPEFSDIPKITFKDIKFKEVGGISDYDTIILYLNFRDGNGDLGLSALDPNDSEYPYNSATYYLATGVDDTTRIIGSIIDDYVVLDAPANSGKLVTNKTRTQPNYNYLPVYDPNDCNNYTTTQVLVQASRNLVDASYNIKDTLFRQSDNEKFLLIEEPLLYKLNPNHFNIEVKFWVFNGSLGTFVEYDWFDEFCITFDGRFPVLSDDGSPLEGTIRYAMSNTSFLSVFGNQTIQISARIRDRSLNVSNEVFTPEFELDDIK